MCGDLFLIRTLNYLGELPCPQIFPSKHLHHNIHDIVSLVIYTYVIPLHLLHAYEDVHRSIHRHTVIDYLPFTYADMHTDGHLEGHLNSKYLERRGRRQGCSGCWVHLMFFLQSINKIVSSSFYGIWVILLTIDGIQLLHITCTSHMRYII